MRQQYLSIKSQYTDCVLLFRLGDFYESVWKLYRERRALEQGMD